MADATCAVAADTKLETPEGPLTVKSLAAKAAPVFTVEDGRVRFRMLHDAQPVAESTAVVRVKLDNGESFRVGGDQIVFLKGMEERRAADLKPGDRLMPMFAYVEGYEFQDDATGATVLSDAAIGVEEVVADGEADVYAFRVHVTGCFFVSAGVLCKAAGA